MLFDTLRKKNQAEQEEREWNANRPTDYVSRNKDAMDSLTGQIGTGFDWDTGSKAYQQYRAQAQANAATSAENAQANAAMLAGGYGSSYADSVAKQGQQQALSGIDNAVPGLRSQALSKYQNQQNDLLSALSGMANTEALDRSAYGSNFANLHGVAEFPCQPERTGPERERQLLEQPLEHSKEHRIGGPDGLRWVQGVHLSGRAAGAAEAGGTAANGTGGNESR